MAHCCAADAPVDLLLGAGAQGVSVDLDALRVGAYDALAGALEKEHAVMLGVVPATDPVTPPTDDAVTERVLRVLDMLGLDPRTAEDLVVTPSCGLAGAGAAWARRALALQRASGTEPVDGVSAASSAWSRSTVRSSTCSARPTPAPARRPAAPRAPPAGGSATRCWTSVSHPAE